MLWLWYRPAAATVPIRPLAWKPPYAAGAARKRQKEKTPPPIFFFIIVDLHCCVNFGCTAKCPRQTYIYIYILFLILCSITNDWTYSSLCYKARLHCRSIFIFIFIFCFLGLHLQHMDVPKLGVKSELQLPATATQDP